MILKIYARKKLLSGELLIRDYCLRKLLVLRKARKKVWTAGREMFVHKQVAIYDVYHVIITTNL